MVAPELDDDFLELPLGVDRAVERGGLELSTDEVAVAVTRIDLFFGRGVCSIGGAVAAEDVATGHLCPGVR